MQHLTESDHWHLAHRVRSGLTVAEAREMQEIDAELDWYERRARTGSQAYRVLVARYAALQARVEAANKRDDAAPVNPLNPA